MENENIENHEITGATIAENQGFEVAPLNDMPMIVWLRGDEDYVEEFSIDADGAMKILGIRRSRLTQISGKELRVGRMRIGRYVRPVYRQADLDAYVEWTRPTATHAKSSNLIGEAASELLRQAEKVSSSYEQVVEKHAHELTQFVDDSFKSSYNIIQELLEQKTSVVNDNVQGLKTLMADLGQLIEDQLKKSDEQMAEMHGKVQEKQDQVKSEVTALNKFCQELNLEVKQQQASLADFIKRQDEAVSGLAKIIKVNLELQKDMQETLKSVVHSIKNIPAPKDCNFQKTKMPLPPPRFK